MMTKEAVSRYLLARRGELAGKTLADAAGTLNRLPDLPLAALDDVTLRAWRDGLPVSEASKNTYMRRAKAFLAYCEHAGWIDKDPSRFIGPLVEPLKRRLRLSGEQIGSMIGTARHPRDRALIAVAATWLQRASEIRMLRVGDLRFDDGYADVWVMKKRGQYAQDEMPITGSLEREIRSWLSDYRQAAGVVGPNAYLFPRLDERLHGSDRVYSVKPLDPCAKPQEVIGQALDRIGVLAPRRGVHDVRRSMARLQYDALCKAGEPDPVGVIKALLHHADRRQTETYIGINAARTRRNTVMRSASWLSVLPTTTVHETAPSGLATVVRLTR